MKKGKRRVPKLYAVCQDFLRLNSVFNNIYGFHLIISEVYSCYRILENFQKRVKKRIKIWPPRDNHPYGMCLSSLFLFFLVTYPHVAINIGSHCLYNTHSLIVDFMFVSLFMVPPKSQKKSLQATTLPLLLSSTSPVSRRSSTQPALHTYLFSGEYSICLRSRTWKLDLDLTPPLSLTWTNYLNLLTLSFPHPYNGHRKKTSPT